MKFITFASHTPPGFQAMIQSAHRVGITPIVLGTGEPYGGLITKLRAMHRYLSGTKEDSELIVFHDAYDVLFCQDAPAIESAISAFSLEDRILFAAERKCSPEPSLAAGYAQCSTPYRFLNSGVYAGKRRLILQMIEESNAFGSPENWDDQMLLTRWYLVFQSKALLDTHCQAFQCLYASESDLELRGTEIWNKLTETRPAIIHGNGLANLSRVREWLFGAPPI